MMIRIIDRARHLERLLLSVRIFDGEKVVGAIDENNTTAPRDNALVQSLLIKGLMLYGYFIANFQFFTSSERLIAGFAYFRKSALAGYLAIRRRCIHALP